ncbi:MAG: hypothetical protein JJE25_04265 [Bacteroidia bacterium]|nr:hypothetical protein [Bacteroidia bacterium]
MNIEHSFINIKLKYILYLFLFIITIGFLILPALQNGYPLVFSDTGTYIYSGYDKFVPIDRPLGYGLFIYLFGKIISSLWVIVILQAMFVIATCHLFVRLFLPTGKSFPVTCLLLITLSFFTGVSNYNSIIIPDIFTSLLLISLAVLLFHNNLSSISKILLALLIIFSITFHFSNLMLALGCVLIFIIASFVLPTKIHKVNLKKLVFVSDVLLTGWIAMPLIHYFHGNEFVWSRAKNVIIMGKFVECGVLKIYLDDKCPDALPSLCNQKNNLPQHAWQFLWEDSPLKDKDCLANGGWVNCWIQKDKEYSPIVRDIITTPKYLRIFAYDSFVASVKQLMTFGIVMMTPLNENGPVLWLIKKYYPNELNQYTSTEQSKRKVFYYGKTLVQNIVVVISLIIIILLLIKKSFRKTLTPQIINMVFFVFTGLVLNAFICATFSDMVDRYQGRVIWLIPLIALTMLVRLIFFKPKVSAVNS